jgi:hypothetical protein
MGAIVATLMNFAPIRHLVQRQARKVMINRAHKLLGRECPNYKEANLEYWENLRSSLRNRSTTYPQYYLREYHGYPQGNLCWEAGKPQIQNHEQVK